MAAKRFAPAFRADFLIYALVFEAESVFLIFEKFLPLPSGLFEMQRLKAGIIQMAKLAALPCVSLTVYAATGKESTAQPMKPSQLSIYCSPPLESKYIEEQPGRLQKGFCSVRQRTNRYLGWCKNVFVFVKNGIMDSIQFGKDAYVYLKNPPPEFLPKAGVITISGLAGIVLSRKGSRFKKIAYPFGLTALGISVCYPAQSIVVAKVTGKRVFSASQRSYEAARSLWVKEEDATKLQQESRSLKQEDKKKKEISNTSAESAVKSKSFDLPESSPAESSHTVDPMSSLGELKVPNLTSGTVKTAKFKPAPELMDHGQSNPEDVDMYSTRS